MELFNGLSAVAGNTDVKSLFYQIHMNQIRDIVVVLYHQNIAAHGAPSQFCKFYIHYTRHTPGVLNFL